MHWLMPCLYQSVYLSSMIHRHPKKNVSPEFCSCSGHCTVHHWDCTCKDPESARAGFPTRLFPSADLLVAWLNPIIFTNLVLRNLGCFRGGETPARERCRLWERSLSLWKAKVNKQYRADLVFLFNMKSTVPWICSRTWSQEGNNFSSPWC